MVSVEHSGSGMSTVEMAHLVEMVHASQASGVGMGLPIGRTVVERDECRFWAWCVAERGTPFQFVIVRMT